MDTDSNRRPGYKTTEFWMSVLAAVAGMVVSSGVFREGSEVERVVGQVAAILAAMGYTLSRTLVKSKE